MIKISVIIPVYNIINYLTQALDSVFSQTMPKKYFEVIVVDDGSKEPIKDKLIHYKYFEYIKFIRQSNKGLPSARNYGIEAARGDFLVFLDADDMINSEKFERQSKILLKNHQASFVYSNTYRSHPYSDIIGRGIRTGKGSSHIDLFFDCAVSIHSTMSRRIQVVDIGMFDENMLYNEDDDFWFRLSVNYGDALYDDYISAFTRIHDSRHSLDDLKVFYYVWKTVEKNSVMFKDALSSHWPRVKYWVKNRRLNYLFVKNSREAILDCDKKYLKDKFQYVDDNVLEKYFNYKALTFLGFLLRHRRHVLFKVLSRELKKSVLI